MKRVPQNADGTFTTRPGRVYRVGHSWSRDGDHTFMYDLGPRWWVELKRWFGVGR